MPVRVLENPGDLRESGHRAWSTRAHLGVRDTSGWLTTVHLVPPFPDARNKAIGTVAPG